MAITIGTLADYMGIGSAKGFVFNIDKKQILQLHLFDEGCTIIWKPKETFTPQQARSFLHKLATLIYMTLHPCYLFTSTIKKVETGHLEEFLDIHRVSGFQNDEEVDSSEIKEKIGKISSVHSTLLTYQSNRILAFWFDGPNSRRGTKEMGIELKRNFPILEEMLTKLFEEASTFSPEIISRLVPMIVHLEAEGYL